MNLNVTSQNIDIMQKKTVKEEQMNPKVRHIENKKLTDINLTISILTLNINAIQSKSQARFFKKQDPTTWCQKETHFSFKETKKRRMDQCGRGGEHSANSPPHKHAKNTFTYRTVLKEN